MAKLYFYYSAMNAGKSTTLLQSNHNYLERGMRTLLFVPKISIRTNSGKIASRIGLSADAIDCDEDYDIYQHVEKLSSPPHCILTDESQFFTQDQIYQLAKIVDTKNIPVLAYGLRSDFRGELFPASQTLLTIADELNEIKTICHCGSKATMNLKVDDHGHVIRNGAQIEIAGNERYIPTCRKHFLEGSTG